MSTMQLIEAVKTGDTGRVAALLDGGADIHERDEHEWTPLNWAAGRGDVAMTRLLLERGADPFQVGRDQRTPYLIALAAGHVDAVRVLRAAEEALGKSSRLDREYCRAYYLRDLRQFPAWAESRINWKEDGDDAAQPLTDDDVVFVHQDLTVTRSMWHGESVIFEAVTPEWERFCTDALEFKVPDDLDLIVPAEVMNAAAADKAASPA